LNFATLFFLQTKVVTPAFNLQPMGPGLYVPQSEGGPDISPGTGFPFRRLLRLSGIRWSYSNPPPCRILCIIILLKYEVRTFY
jgi:hypothetical protein